MVPASQARGDPARDLRDHRVPGAGDGGGAPPRGILARRRRPPAPRHGQEDQGGDGQAARPLRRRLQGGGHRRGQGRRDLRPARQVRRLRLQQVPRRSLRGRVLPDRLGEGEPPGRVPRRLDEPRHRQHRQALGIPPGGAAARHQGRGALHQPLAGALLGAPRRDPLCARRREGRGPPGHGGDRRRARGRAVQKDLADFARRLPPKVVNKRILENLVSAGAFDDLEPDRAPAPSPPSSRCCRSPPRRPRPSRPASSTCSAASPRRTCRCASPSTRAGPPPSGSSASTTRWASSSRATRSTNIPSSSGKLRVQRWSEFVRSVRAGARVGRLAATVLDRQERRTKSGSKMGILQLSDQTGHFEVDHILGGRSSAFPRRCSSRAPPLVDPGFDAAIEGEGLCAPDQRRSSPSMSGHRQEHRRACASTTRDDARSCSVRATQGAGR